MKTRTRQIHVQTTQEAYDWVAVQAETAGLSHGAVVAEILEAAARQGWALKPREVTIP